MFCRNCGSRISDEAVICPQCGTATEKLYANTYAQSEPVTNETNVLAIVGFILSFFVAMAGLVCSIIGYRQAKEPKYNGNGKSFALAGIIISSVSMGIAFITVFTVFGIIGCAVANYPYI